MKKLFNKYVFAAILVFSVYYFRDKFDFFFTSKERANIDANTKTVDSLKEIISDCQQYQENLLIQNIELEDNLSRLKSRLQKDKETINDLKKEANEKARNVSSFTHDDITKFLSDRYQNRDTTN